jgi:hypothetical protein
MTFIHYLEIIYKYIVTLLNARNIARIESSLQAATCILVPRDEGTLKPILVHHVQVHVEYGIDPKFK